MKETEQEDPNPELLPIQAAGAVLSVFGARISLGFRPSLTVVAAAVWLSTVVAVMVLLIEYSNSPGNSGAPPIHWPTHSQIAFDAKRPTLVMFAHPRCPCTRASVGELELLMASCPTQVIA